MGTSADVLVGATGAVYGGVAGTPLPVDATAALNAGFKDLGFVTEDGVTESVGQDTTEIKAWGGSTIRKIQTAHTVEVKFTLMETNPDAVSAYYGSANVVGTDEIKVTADMATRQAWVIEVLDGDNVVRVVIPDGEVTAHDDITYKTDSAIALGMTLTCYPDASGVKMYKYLDTPGMS